MRSSRTLVSIVDFCLFMSSVVVKNNRLSPVFWEAPSSDLILGHCACSYRWIFPKTRPSPFSLSLLIVTNYPWLQAFSHQSNQPTKIAFEHSFFFFLSSLLHPMLLHSTRVFLQLLPVFTSYWFLFLQSLYFTPCKVFHHFYSTWVSFFPFILFLFTPFTACPRKRNLPSISESILNFLTALLREILLLFGTQPHQTTLPTSHRQKSNSISDYCGQSSNEIFFYQKKRVGYLNFTPCQQVVSRGKKVGKQDSHLIQKQHPWQ